jgi:nitroimidazol reductase NimA-like FMN-containing flavoprotein (pyridoxamine 5'-phosphate oxidase superfamily)
MSEPLDSDAIEHLLQTAAVARLGCHAEGRTYVVPVSYAYYGGACYGHMSEGLKLRMLRANPSVCVQIDRVQGLSRWESVIAWGTFEELSGNVAREGAELFMQRIHTALTGHEAGSAELARLVERALARGVVYRIRLDEKTGRGERGGVAATWLDGAPGGPAAPQP